MNDRTIPASIAFGVAIAVAAAMPVLAVSSSELGTTVYPVVESLPSGGDRPTNQSPTPIISQSAADLEAVPDSADEAPSASAESLDLDSEVIEDSPVLQRWLEDVPNVQSDIRRDPSFRTRLRVGYSQFPDADDDGFSVGVEDVFVGRTGLTVSGEYQGTFEGDRATYGADLRYYVRPLGSYVNVAPVIGYRHVDIDEQAIDGMNLGLRLLLSLSRTGAADIALTQSWVAPGSDEEVGITTLSVGYALTPNLRLSTDLQKQNSPYRKDSRVGVLLEWML